MPSKYWILGVRFPLLVDHSFLWSRANEAGCILVLGWIVSCLFAKMLKKGSIKCCVSILSCAYERICSSVLEYLGIMSRPFALATLAYIVRINHHVLISEWCPILAPSTPDAYHPDVELHVFSQHVQYLPAPLAPKEYESNFQYSEYVRFPWLFVLFVSHSSNTIRWNKMHTTPVVDGFSLGPLINRGFRPAALLGFWNGLLMTLHKSTNLAARGCPPKF